MDLGRQGWLLSSNCFHTFVMSAITLLCFCVIINLRFIAYSDLSFLNIMLWDVVIELVMDI